MTAPSLPVPPTRGAGRTVRVRDVLRECILAGGYESGFLPSERELMLEYAASRGTVREALQLLRDEGLIERRQGTGTFVVLRKARHRFDHVHGVGSSYRERRPVRGHVVSVERVLPPEPVRERLRLPADDECVHVEFHTHVGDQVFNTNSSFLAVPAGTDLPGGVFDGDFYEYLEAHGMPVHYGELVVEAVNADAAAAAVLGVRPGAALMLFRRVLFTTADRPLEFGFVRCRGDQLALATRLPRQTKELTWLTS